MTALTPAFYVFLFALVCIIVTVKKENIAVPMIVAMCFLPADLALNIGGMNFFAIRIVALVGLCRVLFDSTGPPLKMNAIDYLFLSFSILGALIYIVASGWKWSAVVYKSGVAVDSVIVYILFRIIVSSREVIYVAIKTLCICVAILFPFVIVEYFTATNLFSFLGRNRISIRGDEIRAMATFSHAILFGSFAAAVTPLFWARYMMCREKLYLFSIIICLFFVIASSSSGPVIASFVVLFMLFFFRFKNYIYRLFWCILCGATFIHFVRESPIWHFVYVRVSIKASSTGYHRFLLFDAAVNEFKDWWALGYGDIGPQWHLKYWPWSHAKFTDVTNHYILEGVRGGIVTMVLFILVCCKVINVLAERTMRDPDKNQQYLWWGVMVMMIAHCISFLSVAYFGQITMLLYMTFAIGAFVYNQNEQIIVSSRQSLKK